MSWDISHLSD